MKKSKFSELQIVSILKEADAGVPVKEVCRKYGISSATCYNWKSKFGGMDASMRSEKPPTGGCSNTTNSARMTLWTIGRHSNVSLTTSEALLSRCLLDGEAYGFLLAFRPIGPHRIEFHTGRVGGRCLLIQLLALAVARPYR